MNGERLPASYANFYIANGVVLVPTFNDPNDRVALNGIAEAFPRYTVIGIHAVDLVWGLGTLHCLTQQQPAGSGGRKMKITVTGEESLKLEPGRPFTVIYDGDCKGVQPIGEAANQMGSESRARDNSVADSGRAREVWVDYSPRLRRLDTGSSQQGWKDLASGRGARGAAHRFTQGAVDLLAVQDSVRAAAWRPVL